MYAIALIINTEVFIPLVLSRNNFAFNHAYIYIVNFIEFQQYYFQAIGTCCING